jgi:mono/diheme cytochrome c family protein
MRRVAIGLLLMFAAPSVRAETLVERGSYLAASVMTCHSCHTPRGPNGPDLSRALSGGQVFDTPAFKVTASNITPDRETGIGAWSDAELKTFFVSGVRPDGTTVAPVMPTAFYRVLTSRDLDALVAYLRSVPAIHRETPTPDYRLKPAPETPPFTDSQARDAEMADPLKRGRYLVTIGHCLECHTPAGPGHGHDFAASTGKGGWVFRGPGGPVVSANITSDPAAGLGRWTDDEIKRAITQGISRDGHALKPPMAYSAYAKMTAQDLDAVVAFVRTLPPRN